MSGSPATAKHARVSSDGRYYLVTNSGGVATQIYRWDGSVWTNITPSGNTQIYEVVAIDPGDPTRLVAVREGGYLNQSHDRGASWDGIVWTMSRAATDIPWLGWTQETYMSVGDVTFDPLVPNKLWFAEGHNYIGRITTTGSFTMLPVPTPESLPVGVTIGPDGRVWFTEELGNAIHAGLMRSSTRAMPAWRKRQEVRSRTSSAAPPESPASAR